MSLALLESGGLCFNVVLKQKYPATRNSKTAIVSRCLRWESNVRTAPWSSPISYIYNVRMKLPDLEEFTFF